MTFTVQRSRVVATGVEDAFTGTLPLPLPVLFRRWYGPIPPIKEVREQAGEWGTVGQTRTVLLVGGGSMRERLTGVDAPHGFDYTLTDITGPLAPLVRTIEGQWRFTHAGAGTEITWRWRIRPRSGFAAPALPVLGWLWRGYARRALEELSTLLGG